MTIAACHLSPEGVVLGADSAITFGARSHFYHGQKIYQVGEPGGSTLGLCFWGLGSMNQLSYRTLIGRFSDEVQKDPNQEVETMAYKWSEMFHRSYMSEFDRIVAEATALSQKNDRSVEEEEKLESLISNFSGGFCLGGHSPSDRVPKAYEITYSPAQESLPAVEEITYGSPRFWGQPNMLQRLSYGIDMDTYLEILEKEMPDGTKMWRGSTSDLVDIVAKNKLGQPSEHLPIREAIDWVYSSIYTTIKAMKFANLPPVCGGPIEIGVITSDRPFRWVRHKEFDTAIGRHPTKEF